jgi:hypothetical protein
VAPEEIASAAREIASAASWWGQCACSGPPRHGELLLSVALGVAMVLIGIAFSLSSEVARLLALGGLLAFFVAMKLWFSDASA